MTIALLRGLIILYWLGMLAFGLDFLRRRRMPAAQYALWGLLALALPGLGPFLVIAIQPGRRNAAAWSGTWGSIQTSEHQKRNNS